MNISAVIPTFNRGYCLLRAINSILAQTTPVDEIIIVDDGSDDKTYDLLIKSELFDMAGRVPTIRYLYQENKGVSAARNAAVKNCDSEWIAFLDSDDFWHPHKLQKQIAQTVIRAKCPIHFTDEIWIRNGVRVNPKKKHQKLEGWFFKPSLELCLMSPSTVLLRRELFDVHGLFDETLPICEDYDLWLRLTAQHQVALLNEKLMTRHGGHADQLSLSEWGIDRYRVQSIIKILKTEKLSPEDRSATKVVLRKKCEIIINGFRKRGKLQEVERYEKIDNQYQIC